MKRTVNSLDEARNECWRLLLTGYKVSVASDGAIPPTDQKWIISWE